MGRQPAVPVAPSDLDKAPAQSIPSSPVAAALDLLLALEREEEAGS